MVGNFQNWEFKDFLLYAKNCQNLSEDLQTNPELANKIRSIFEGVSTPQILMHAKLSDFMKVITKVSLTKNSLLTEKAIDAFNKAYGGLSDFDSAILCNNTARILELVRGPDAPKHPLHIAAKWGNVEAINVLLENGASIDEKNLKGMTPLHVAASYGNTNVIHTLLEKRAKVNEKDNSGKTPLHYGAGYEEVTKALLEKGVNVDKKDIQGKTALHYAAGFGNINSVTALLKNGAKVDEKDKFGQTPLQIAAQNQNKEIILVFLKNGAKVGALHIAAKFGYTEEIKALIDEGANIYENDQEGNTAIELIVMNRHTQTLQNLIENGYVDIHYKNTYGNTLLHVALLNNHVNTAFELIKMKAPLFTQNNEGKRPFDYFSPIFRQKLEKALPSITKDLQLMDKVEACEKFVREDRPIPIDDVNLFLNDLEKSLPLILSKPALLRRMTGLYGEKIEAEVKKFTLPTEKAHFIPFLTPREVIETVQAVKNDYRAEKAVAVEQLKFAATQLANTIREEVLSLTIYDVVHRILPETPYVALALIARENPQLIKRYLLDLEAEQLSAVIPFLKKELVMETLFKEGKLAISLDQLADWVKRMPLDLKREVYWALYDELLFYPRSYEKLIQAAQEENLNEEKINAIRAGYAGLEREELPLAKLAEAFNQGDIDLHEESEEDPNFNTLIKEEVAEGAEKKQLLKSLVEKLPKPAIPGEFVDYETGDVMRVPIVTPVYNVTIDESTFKNPAMFPKRTVTSYEDNKQVTHTEIQNFYNKNWYPESAYKVDNELKQRLDAFHSKTDEPPSKKQKQDADDF